MDEGAVKYVKSLSQSHLPARRSQVFKLRGGFPLRARALLFVKYTQRKDLTMH